MAVRLYFCTPFNGGRRVCALPLFEEGEMDIKKPAPRARSRKHKRKKGDTDQLAAQLADRKSTRLNSSHSQISYAVFCLKKKNSYWGVGRVMHEMRQAEYDGWWM